MKKIYFQIMVVALFVLVACQEDIGPDPAVDETELCNSDGLPTARNLAATGDPTDMSTTSCTEYTVQVVVHNIMNSDGDGYDHADIDAAMASMQEDFEGFNIYFDYSIEDLVDDDYYDNQNSFDWSSYMRKDFPVTSSPYNERIDVLFFPALSILNSPPPGVSSRENAAISVGGYFPYDSDGDGIQEDSVRVIETKIVSHEMGHALGLSHYQVCGNIMQNSDRDLDCLENFSDSQGLEMRTNLETESFLADLFETELLCCEYSEWELSGLPGSTVTIGDEVNYTIEEINNETQVYATSPVIRVYAANFVANVKYNGTSYGISKDSYVDIEIDGSSECSTETSIEATLQFYTFDMPGSENLEITVELYDMGTGHSFDSSSHSFSLN